jgi:hypothetical protein
MHPIEHLRYVARSSGGDQRTLVRETASAMRSMAFDPSALVVACRRITERHPTSGPLWWMCSTVLTAPDPIATAVRLANAIVDDTTPDTLIDSIGDGATVCVIGWPDLVGEAMLRRGDITVLVVDAGDEGSSFVRMLQRNDVECEVVAAAGLAGAAVSSDLVLVEALAASDSELLATAGSRAAASVGYCSDVPVWGVVGLGRCVPQQLFTNMTARVYDRRQPWDADVDVVPLGLLSAVVRPDGLFAPDPLVAECPLATELLHSSPM